MGVSRKERIVHESVAEGRRVRVVRRRVSGVMMPLGNGRRIMVVVVSCRFLWVNLGYVVLVVSLVLCCS